MYKKLSKFASQKIWVFIAHILLKNVAESGTFFNMWKYGYLGVGKVSHI